MVMLWFAWKIVLLQYHKQRISANKCANFSCDLLEKSYFCSITNSALWKKATGYALWFAWKIVLLQYHKQHTFNILTLIFVVICLKNRTFAVSQTAIVPHFNKIGGLWFAWKIVLLQYHKQLLLVLDGMITRCDLLEKSYFCSITNSWSKGCHNCE